MAHKQICTSEEKQKKIAAITQEIINCDDWIFKLMYDTHLQFIWIEKKQRLEYELQDLTSDDLI
jgi:hypothetical protein